VRTLAQAGVSACPWDAGRIAGDRVRGHSGTLAQASADSSAARDAPEVARLLRVYPDSSERLNDLTVRVRSLLANSAATGFINRIKPKRSPSAT
jgi:hypothetical protein